MSCLTHDKRFCSSFHNIINELRNENRTLVSILRSMPSKCCTCNDETKETIESVIMKEENQLIKLQNLIERVNREKPSNSKLVLSLNRFENLIEKNRAPAPVLSVENHEKITKGHVPNKRGIKPKHIVFGSSSSDSNTSSDSDNDVPKKCQTKVVLRQSSSDSSSSDSDNDSPKKRQTKLVLRRSSSQSNSSLDLDDVIPMETSKPIVKRGKQQNQKKSKPIKNGTFLFLPYTSKGKTASNKTDSLLEVAKALQRNRFIGRNGHIALLQKQYDVHINMITRKTSKQITEALENAKQGFENLKICNQNESIAMADKQEGEWVLIRSKKPQKETKTDNFEQLLDDLTNRWETCLTIKKRKL